MVRTKTIVTIVLVSAVVFTAAFGMFGIIKGKNTSYVRIVDVSKLQDGDSPSPGVDLRGVELYRPSRKKSYYARTVISGRIKNGNEGNNNNYKNTDSILGDPNEGDTSDHLSLGGGEIVVSLPRIMRSGDELTVHEVGGNNSARADLFEIYISSSSNGPWELVGTGSGPTTVTIQ